MSVLLEKSISCPYCGEWIDVLINHEEADTQYIEDCQVCCRPIVFDIRLDNAGDIEVFVKDENEV